VFKESYFSKIGLEKRTDGQKQELKKRKDNSKQEPRKKAERPEIRTE